VIFYAFFYAYRNSNCTVHCPNKKETLGISTFHYSLGGVPT